MNENIKSLEKTLNAQQLEDFSLMNLLNLESKEVIFNFDHYSDNFKVFKNSENGFILAFFPDFDYESIIELGWRKYNYYLIDKLEDVFKKIDEIIETFLDGCLLSSLGSDTWWSFLPNWMCLTPYEISPDYTCFIKNKLLELKKEINIETNLSKTERTVFDNWLEKITLIDIKASNHEDI